MVDERIEMGIRRYGGTSEAGDRNTIHEIGMVNVETDVSGKVVAVWYRCALLPFDETVVDSRRAAEMRTTYEAGSPARIHAIEFDDGVR